MNKNKKIKGTINGWNTIAVLRTADSTFTPNGQLDQ
jgi:hypothetical protein